MWAISLHVPACAMSFSRGPTTNPFFLHINWLYSLSSLLSFPSLSLSWLLLHLLFVETQGGRNYQLPLSLQFLSLNSHLHFCCCYPTTYDESKVCTIIFINFTYIFHYLSSYIFMQCCSFNLEFTIATYLHHF